MTDNNTATSDKQQATRTQPEILEEIKKILWRHLDRKKYRAFVYGSRAVGDSFKWSDVDVGIEGDKPIPMTEWTDIEDDLEQSNIPFMVEVVDFKRVDKDFYKRAKQKVIPLN